MMWNDFYCDGTGFIQHKILKVLFCFFTLCCVGMIILLVFYPLSPLYGVTTMKTVREPNYGMLLLKLFSPNVCLNGYDI